MQMKLKQNSIKTKKIKYYNIFLFFSLCLVSCLISITQVFAEGEGGNSGGGNGSNNSSNSSNGSSNNTVSSTSSANASVTVSSACSFTRTNSYDAQTGYTGILANNASIEITGSTFKTLCNDPGGYAIYAIGYSNNEYGNTDLIYNNGPTSTYNIKTNGDTSGNSSWKMKLTPVVNNFTPTIENSYNNFSNIPSTYTKVASYNNVTVNSSDSTTGSNVTTYYKATASSTQPAGTYTGAVKYTMVHPGTTPAAYFMQDVADWKTELPNPGDTFQAVDRRDGKVYWVARLADGNIWMTQNLDLDIDETKTYTHYDTDLGWNDPNNLDVNATWQPTAGHSTIDFTSDTVDGWVGSYTEPYSANPGDIYYYTSNSTTADTKYTSLQACQTDSHNDCEHYHAGNYYNFTAATASNDSSSATSGDAPNSICPAGWRLPKNSANEFANLLVEYNVISDISSTQYANNGLNIIRSNPLYFIRSGDVRGSKVVSAAKTEGLYRSSTSSGAYLAYSLRIQTTVVYPALNSLYELGRNSGQSLRCLAR